MKKLAGPSPCKCKFSMGAPKNEKMLPGPVNSQNQQLYYVLCPERPYSKLFKRTFHFLVLPCCNVEALEVAKGRERVPVYCIYM